MKEIEVDAPINSDKPLLEDVRRLTQLLENEMGNSAAEITASWKV